MKDVYLRTLTGCALFEDIEAVDIPTMLRCLSPTVRSYARGEVVFAEGASLAQVGIVLSGRVQIEQNDYWGNRAILAQAEPGELFGEAFSCAGVRALPVSVCAALPCEIMLIDYRRIVRTCSSACAFHGQLIQNMLRILAEKNVALTQKIETVTQRTTRDKLLAYLSAQARRQGMDAFEIPFNRQELADYLSVDRSAMSSELSRMRRDGLVRCEKNRFELL